MSDVRLLEPTYLWLLMGPGVLFVAWLWQFAKRRRDIRRLLNQHTTPKVERYVRAGGLSFWLVVIAASSLLVMALSRPQVMVSVTQNTNVDFIVLQDGSASMRVTDVAPDRWQRSVSWLRTFAEVLSWRRERVALALFARRPAPQVRLTGDPNALFFFLDHLTDEPPFRLLDDTSWDTNIEDAIYWGVKMLDKDEELHGRRLSAKAFVVLSDGQAWSGEVARALTLVEQRNIRVYVVGVGTAAGGVIPQAPRRLYQEPEPLIHSVLDRQSLRSIARTGRGAYYELGSEPDEVIALKILADIQRAFRGMFQRQEEFADLYYYFLFAAAALVGGGTLLLKERAQLCWQLLVTTLLAVVLLS